MATLGPKEYFYPIPFSKSMKRNLTCESPVVDCQKARGMIWAVTAATSLYQDEFALIGVNVKGPEVLLILRAGPEDDLMTGITEPTFSVTFRLTASAITGGIFFYIMDAAN